MPSMMARLKELGDENRRLKKMYAEERLKAEIIQEQRDKKNPHKDGQACSGTARQAKKQCSYFFPKSQIGLVVQF